MNLKDITVDEKKILDRFYKRDFVSSSPNIASTFRAFSFIICIILSSVVAALCEEYGISFGGYGSDIFTGVLFIGIFLSFREVYLRQKTKNDFIIAIANRVGFEYSTTILPAGEYSVPDLYDPETKKSYTIYINNNYNVMFKEESFI